MAALEDFMAYLSQAYDNAAIARLDLEPPRRRPGTPIAACATGRREDRRATVLATGCIHALAKSPLRAVRDAMEQATLGLLIVERQQALRAIRRACEEAGLHIAFLGKLRGRGAIAVLQGDRGQPPPPAPGFRAPRDFRVLAIVPTYNEEDVISGTLADLLEQGLDVYVLDNWSVDSTVERASEFLGRGLVRLERFPAHGPTCTYDLSAILSRVEQVALEQSWVTWFMLHDADERRRSPWPGVRLREALWHADASGYSCVDHVTLNFWPVDESFDPGVSDLEQHFSYFEFSDHPGHFHQRRAWRRTSGRVTLAPSAGHDVTFPGRRVYPYKFLLKHYPIRSQAHGERKVLGERIARWHSGERARGWHRQYDGLQGRSFVRDPSSLSRFDPLTFPEDYLLERLSGAGIFVAPPSWATPPRW